MHLGSSNDGVIFANWKIEQGHLVRTMVQPSEDAILDRNAELRKSPDALRKLDWGQVMLSIPENVFWLLVKTFPDLNATNSEARTAAWMRLAHDRDYEKFLLRPRNLARG